MRSSLAHVVVASLGAVGFAGCDAFGTTTRTSEAGDAAPPPPDAVDADVAGDAGAHVDAGDAGDTNLILPDERGFENRTLGGDCGSISAFKGQDQVIATGHESAKACRVCRDGTDSGYTLDVSSFAQGIRVGDAFAAGAWVRSELPAGRTARIVLRTLDAAGKDTGDTGSSLDIELTTSWQPLRVLFTASMAANAIDLYIGVPQAEDTCLDVDDIVATRVP